MFSSFAALAPTIALGQFATVINAPPNPLPGAVASNTQVNMGAGATWQLADDNLIRSGVSDGSSSNIEINVTGGTIRNSIELYAGTTLNFSGGESNRYFYGHQGSVANISGGTARYFYATSGAAANVSGGVIEGQSHFLSGSTLNISGGMVGNRHFDSLTVDSGATVNVSGGVVGAGFNLYGGVANVTGGSIYDHMDIGSGSSLKLFGDDFRIDGVPVGGLGAIGSSLQVDVPSQSTLSGVYSDGTPFAFIMPYNSIGAGALSLHRTFVAPATPGTFSLPGAKLPMGIREGQRIVVGNGGVMPEYYTAGRGSQVEVQAGGALGENFKAVGAVVDVYGNLAKQSMFVTDGGVLNLRDGQAPDSTTYIEVYRSSEMNVSGGDWGNATAQLRPGSKATFSGGRMNYIYAEREVEFTMSGGKVREVTLADSQVPAILSGGEIEALMLPRRGDVQLTGATIGVIGWGNANGRLVQTAGVVRREFAVDQGAVTRLEGGAIGGGLQLHAAGTLEIAGGDFRLNGELVAGLETPGASKAITVPAGALLSGTLADGTPFAFNSNDTDYELWSDDLKGTVKLFTVALPTVTPGTILASSDPNRLGVRDGQTLVINAGDVVRDVFNIGRGGRVEFNAGVMGQRVEVVGGELEMTGGVLGDRFDAYDGAVVNISGGSVGHLFEAHAGSQVHISGGSFGDWFTAKSGSDVKISGGDIQRADVEANAQFAVSGGKVGVLLLQDNALASVNDGTVQEFVVRAGGRVDLHAGRLGGASSTSYDRRVNGTVDQYGGTIGQSLQVSGVVNSHGGVIEHNGRVYNNGVLNVKGGSVGSGWVVESGGKINLQQGSIASATLQSGAQLFASGGSVGGLDVYGTAQVDEASIGAASEVFFGGRFELRGGTLGRGVNVRTGGQLHLYGSNFTVNGEPVSGLSEPGSAVAFFTSPTTLITGVLADGSPIAIAPQQLSALGLGGDTLANGTLTLHSAAPVAAPVGVFQAADHPDWFGVRSAQTLVVGPGASVRSHFTAERGSILEVQTGGAIGAQADAVGARVRIQGGDVGNALFAYDGTTIDMTAGSLGANSGLFAGSLAIVSGGVVGERLALETGSSLTVDGGVIGRNLRVASGAVATIRGGLLVDGVTTSANARIELVGADFRLNGVPVADFDEATGLRQLNIPTNGVLTGTYSDGSPFVFSNARSQHKDVFADGTLTLRRSNVAALPQQIEITAAETTPRAAGVGVELQVSAGGRLADYSLLGQESQSRIAPGGLIGSDVELFGGVLDVNSGAIGSRFAVHHGGVLNLSGGTIGSQFSVNAGGVLNQFGGSINSTLRILTGATWNLFGSNFAINGMPVAVPIPGSPLEITSRSGTLTGTLANGDSFSVLLGPVNPRQGVGALQGGALYVYAVPEPSTLALTLGVVAIGIAATKKSDRKIGR